jgi:hypothetical protein
MIAQAGYSGTPLPQKLGLKDGHRVAFAGLPEHLGDRARSRAFANAETRDDWDGIEGKSRDFIQMFTKSAATVARAVPGLRGHIRSDGMIWVSWPKKASKVPTDVTEDTVRNTALAHDMVDVKVCAVDEVWSGLKIVIRKEYRAAYAAEKRTN